MAQWGKDTMNDMGHDSKLTYDEVGERLQSAAPDLVDYFPFGDGRDDLIDQMKQVLREAMIFWQINSDLSERYFGKWQEGQKRTADLLILLEHIRNAYPDVEEWPVWIETMEATS